MSNSVERFKSFYMKHKKIPMHDKQTLNKPREKQTWVSLAAEERFRARSCHQGAPTPLTAGPEGNPLPSSSHHPVPGARGRAGQRAPHSWRRGDVPASAGTARPGRLPARQSSRPLGRLADPTRLPGPSVRPCSAPPRHRGGSLDTGVRRLPQPSHDPRRRRARRCLLTARLPALRSRRVSEGAPSAFLKTNGARLPPGGPRR